MPLFIPFLLMGAAAALGGVGVKKGYDGVSAINRAKEIGRQAEARHRRHVVLAEDARTNVNGVAAKYGKLKLETRRVSFGRLLEVLKRLENSGGREGLKLLQSVDIDREMIADFRAQVLEAETTLKGLVTAGLAGATAASATYGFAGVAGIASTGAAISGLSGAAATSATLAWLGGGSLAAGGFGMAGGAIVLGGIVAGPALAITGFLVGSEGEKALTQAEEYRARVERAVADLATVIAFLARVERRLTELHGLVAELRARLDKQLDEVEQRFALGFDVHNKRHVALLHTAVNFATALSEVMKAPVMEANGTLAAGTAQIIGRYKQLAAS